MNDYSSLFYSNPFPILVLRFPDWVIADMNPAAEALFGCAKKEFIGRDPDEIFQNDSLCAALSAVQPEIIDKKAVGVGNFFCVASTEGSVELEIHAHKAEWEGIEAVVLICQDITRSRAARQRLKSLSNDFPGVVFQYVVEPNGRERFMAVGASAADIWQLTPEQCEQDPTNIWRQIEAGGNATEVKADLLRAIKTRTQWKSRWRNVLPNGTVRWHQVYGSPLFMQDGTVVINAMVLDVTDEVISQINLQEAFDLAKIGSWELNLASEGDDMYWSPMVKEILEVDPSYNPSLTRGFEFYDDKSREQIQSAVGRLIAEGEPFDVECQVITGNGKEKWIRCIGRGEIVDGRCVKIYGSFQDIHATKTADLLVRQILESISDAFYAVDKDWNFTYFNQEAERLLRINREEVIGKNIWDLFSPAKGTELEIFYREVALMGIPRSFEYKYPGDGSWYEINTYPFEEGVSSYFRNIDGRHKAAEALRKADEDKNRILKSIGDAFFALEASGAVAYWNVKAEETFGYTSQEVVGEILWERIPAFKQNKFFEGFQRAVSKNIPDSFEEYFSENEQWFDVNIYPTPEGVSVFWRDITSQKWAQERVAYKSQQLNIIAEMNAELLSYESWYKVIEKAFGKIGECVGVDRIYYFQNQLDPETGQMSTSQRLEWSAGDVPAQINNPELQYIPFTLVQDFIEPLRNNAPFTTAIRDMADTDTKRLLEGQEIRSILVLPIFVSKEFWGFIGFDDCKREREWSEDDVVFLRTITGNLSAAIEAELTHAELERSYEENTSILESIGDAFFAVDNQWTVTYWNAQAERFLNRKKEDIIGYNLWEKYADAVDTDFFHMYHKAKQTKQILSFEEYYAMLDKWFEVTAYPTDKGLSIYFKDVTQRKQSTLALEEANVRLSKYAKELKDSNEQLEQFAFITSHDLQEPLRMITSFLNQLQRKYGSELDAKANQYINFAVDGAQRMKAVILDLLEYSRAGRTEEKLTPVSLMGVIEEYAALRRKLIAEKKVTLKYENLPEVNCFRVPLIQTMHCLLDNAIKYSKLGVPPVICISVEEMENHWVIQVVDNGIGIDPRFFEKIFVIFQRLHNRGDFEGTGIGLSIAKKQVESWGGKIWVESEPGKGSRFYFTIKK